MSTPILDKLLNFQGFDSATPNRTMTLQYTSQMNSSGYVNIWFTLKLLNLPILTDN